jgi:uncharacterized protein
MASATDQYRIACRYMKGEDAPVNKEEAAKWFHLAAENGHVDAQFRMGVCYEKGSGVKQNLPEALAWYNRAAAQGSIAAKNNLLVCYATAGVELDQEIANLREIIDLRRSTQRD